MPMAPNAPGRITHSSAHTKRKAGRGPNASRTKTYTPPERGNAAATESPPAQIFFAAMPRSFPRLAWLTAFCTYLLIVRGAIVRITGWGMGWGDHWPLCNGKLLPPLDDIGTLIEWNHRLAAAAV